MLAFIEQLYVKVVFFRLHLFPAPPIFWNYRFRGAQNKARISILNLQTIWKFFKQGHTELEKFDFSKGHNKGPRVLGGNQC